MGYYEVGGTFTPKRFKRTFYFRLTLFLMGVISSGVITLDNFCDRKIEQKKQHETFIETYKEWYDNHPGEYGPPPQAK